jgi:hypothetical protein
VRRAASLLGLLLVLRMSACAAEDDDRPGEDDLSAFISGAEAACATDAECVTGVCSWGICSGFLLADRPWMTRAIATALARELERRGLAPEDVREELQPLVVRSDQLPALRRARLLRGWALVDERGAIAAAHAVFKQDTEPMLAFEAARVLLRSGREDAGDHLAAEVRRSGSGVVHFILNDWRFFSSAQKAAILDVLRRDGDDELRRRLTAEDAINRKGE